MVGLKKGGKERPFVQRTAIGFVKLLVTMIYLRFDLSA